MNTAHFITCTAIFAGWLFLYVVHYLNLVASLNFKQWDVKTITAADFTIQVDIPKEVFDSWEVKKKFKTAMRDPSLKEASVIAKIERESTGSFKHYFTKQVLQ